MADGRARVLCVCEGNICRSPAMEFYLKREWGDDAELVSAGTYAMVGWQIPDPMMEVLEAEHLDGTEHDPAQLDAGAINAATLILVAGVEQRNWIVKLSPEAQPKAFLLTEAAALSQVVPHPKQGNRAERIAAAARLLHEARGALAGHKHEDILDPYGLSAEHHRQSMAQMRVALDQVVEWIGR